MSSSLSQLLICLVIAVIVMVSWETWFERKKRIHKQRQEIERQRLDLELNYLLGSEFIEKERRSSFSQVSPGIGNRKNDL